MMVYKVISLSQKEKLIGKFTDVMDGLLATSLLEKVRNAMQDSTSHNGLKATIVTTCMLQANKKHHAQIAATTGKSITLAKHGDLIDINKIGADILTASENNPTVVSAYINEIKPKRQGELAVELYKQVPPEIADDFLKVIINLSNNQVNLSKALIMYIAQNDQDNIDKKTYIVINSIKQSHHSKIIPFILSNTLEKNISSVINNILLGTSRDLQEINIGYIMDEVIKDEEKYSILDLATSILKHTTGLEELNAARMIITKVKKAIYPNLLPSIMSYTSLENKPEMAKLLMHYARQKDCAISKEEFIKNFNELLKSFLINCDYINIKQIVKALTVPEKWDFFLTSSFINLNEVEQRILRYIFCTNDVNTTEKELNNYNLTGIFNIELINYHLMSQIIDDLKSE